MAYEGPRSYRPLIMGRRGAVASNHPLATQAGLLAPPAGGNAIDAAGAGGPAPAGGGAGMLGPRGGGVSSGVGTRSPAGGRVSRGAAIPASGPGAVSWPGSVGAGGAMHARFGRRPWASLIEAAIHYARDGYGATRACRHFAGEQAAVLRADHRSRGVFLTDGHPPA